MKTHKKHQCRLQWVLFVCVCWLVGWVARDRARYGCHLGMCEMQWNQFARAHQNKAWAWNYRHVVHSLCCHMEIVNGTTNTYAIGLTVRKCSDKIHLVGVSKCCSVCANAETDAKRSIWFISLVTFNLICRLACHFVGKCDKFDMQKSSDFLTPAM